MKKQVWKFEITLPNMVFEVPLGAEILTVQMVREITSIYFLVNPLNDKESRKFNIYPTGSDIYFESKYIGTCQTLEGHFIFHVFETF